MIPINEMSGSGRLLYNLRFKFPEMAVKNPKEKTKFSVV